MADKSDAQKTPAQTNDTDGLGCLALVLAISLSLFISFGISGIYLSEPAGTALFYPLLLITQYGPFQALLWSGVTIIFLGLVIFAAQRGKMIAALLTFLVGGFFLFFLGFGFGSSQKRIQPYQTLYYQNHVYHLVSVWEAAYDLGPETEEYQVLECDTTGLICYRLQTSYSVRLRNYDGDFLNDFNRSGEIFIDEAARKLMLRVGAEIDPILSINPA